MIDFTVVVLVQLAFFVVHALSVGERKNILRYLGRGMIVGLPFGIVFDLIVGKSFGVFEYRLGFDIWFLALNGLLSYGFMMANVLLLHDHSVRHMYLWSAGLGLVYETANYFFPVWEWTFKTAYLEYAVVILAGYAGLAWLMMLVLRVVYKTRFKLVPM